MAPVNSQYELERDARIKRNEEFMLSLGINPYGSGYMKQNTKAPPKPRLPRKKVPESERRRQRAALSEFDTWMDDFEASASVSFMNVVRYHRFMYTQVDGAHTSRANISAWS